VKFGGVARRRWLQEPPAASAQSIANSIQREVNANSFRTQINDS